MRIGWISRAFGEGGMRGDDPTVRKDITPVSTKEGMKRFADRVVAERERELNDPQMLLEAIIQDAKGFNESVITVSIKENGSYAVVVSDQEFSSIQSQSEVVYQIDASYYRDSDELRFGQQPQRMANNDPIIQELNRHIHNYGDGQVQADPDYSNTLT